MWEILSRTGKARVARWCVCLVTGVGLLWILGQPPRGDASSSLGAGQVGLVVARLLEQHHYKRQSLDDSISRQFFTNYLNALDYNHMFFLQSDIDRFGKYSDTLDDSLLVANLTPAFEIFAVYSNRVEQAVAQVKDLLKEEYRFDGDDAFRLDRREAAWPANEKDARALLRQRVKFEILEERLGKEKPEEIIKIIGRRYDRILRSVHETDAESVIDIYLNALTQTYDPHSQYMAPSSLEQFNIDMKLSLTGIGAVLRSEDGYAKIVEVVPGGPADLDRRLKVKDRIAAVAQGEGEWVDVVDMTLSKVVKLIRGPKGTVVRLKIIPGDAADSSVREEIRIVRDEIKLTAQEAKAKVYPRKGSDGRIERLGYIELPSFYADMHRGPESKSSSRDVAILLEKLTKEGIDGLIIDLRRNSGGSLTEAVALTGLFIDEGPIVQVKHARGRVDVTRDRDEAVAYNGPMIVLVSRQSASASEIFAAALQDYGRAIIVGDHNTFGKGTVQQIVELDPLIEFKRDKAVSAGALKLTIQKFYRVTGGSTQSRGVIPDVHLPSILDARELGEGTLPNALLYDEVAPASFRRWSQAGAFVDQLRSHSRQRVEKDPEFGYIREDIERVRKMTGEKAISLNESKREAEKKAASERTEARKKERLARKSEPPSVIEVSLNGSNGKSNQVAAVTAKVLEAAANESRKDDEPDADEPTVDPVLDEGLAILDDLIGLLAKNVANR